MSSRRLVAGRDVVPQDADGEQHTMKSWVALEG